MKNRLFGVLIIIFITIILALSLISYNTSDLFYPHEHIKNFIGLFGVKLSSFLLSEFGTLAFFIPVLLILSIFSYYKGTAKFIRSLIFIPLSIIFIAMILYVIFGADGSELIKKGYYVCGISGYILGSKIEYYLGTIGSVIILIPFAVLLLYFSSKEFLLVTLKYYNRGEDRKKQSNTKKKVSGMMEKKLDDSEAKTEEDRKPHSDYLDIEYNQLDGDKHAADRENVKRKNGLEIEFAQKEKKGELKNAASDEYEFPPIDLLKDPIIVENGIDENEIYKNAEILEEKLKNFGVYGKVVHVRPGPVVTMYEFRPKAGIKISKIANLSNDLAMAMRAISIRIIAPIPGKAVVGIEISNKNRQVVYMKDIIVSKTFISSRSLLTLGLGKDITGASFITDLDKMPHLLIAGATGSGKSVAVNTMIISMLYKAKPDEVKFVMIDPKMLELSVYDGIPHMLMPVVVDIKEASGSLAALVEEMETRYKIMSEAGVRNIDGFNKKAKKGIIDYATMPYIVVVIDELADLMMVSSKKVEMYIARLAQMARAAGIHLIVATQRPSVDVLTGLIKANFPARISFKVSSKVDSRTILDGQGAEMLLGKGDMLFLQPGTSTFTRIHSAFISDEEIQGVTDFLKTQGAPEYNEELINAAKEANDVDENKDIELDDLFDDAVHIIEEGGNPTISYIQRKLRVGYNRAARIVEQMEKKGILSKPDEKGKRELLIP